MKLPSIGRVVLLVISSALASQAADALSRHEELRANLPKEGEIYPATIVRVWPGPGGTVEPQSLVNLQVHLDGNFTLWVTSAHVDANKAPGTYHWPEISAPVATTQAEPVKASKKALRAALHDCLCRLETIRETDKTGLVLDDTISRGRSLCPATAG
jgi:hypothetical protein